jgi:hypothetical protein
MAILFCFEGGQIPSYLNQYAILDLAMLCELFDHCLYHKRPWCTSVYFRMLEA